MIRRSRRDELENQLNRGALWAVTYGDIMSYLMIFFLIMFSFSVSKRERRPKSYEDSLASIQKVFGGKLDAARAERLRQMKQEEGLAERLQQDLESRDLGKYVEVKANEERVQLDLKEPVLFDSGKAELKPQARTLLAPIAAQIRDMPNTIVIEGYTDNAPIRGGRYATNWELSMARAYAVLKFFEEQGLVPSRLSGSGYGEHRPSADNRTAEGRARNRRIGISLIRTK